MRIVISSDSDRKLDSSVSHHFGRCPYFTVVDIDGASISGVRAEKNPYFTSHSPGQVPSHIRELGADAMLAGGMGRRAITIFGEFGIDCCTGASGSVRSAVEAYLAGTMKDASPCAESAAHAHGDEDGHEYESAPPERLREEAAALIEELDEVIVRLPDRDA